MVVGTGGKKGCKEDALEGLITCHGTKLMTKRGGFRVYV